MTAVRIVIIVNYISEYNVILKHVDTEILVSGLGNIESY